MIIKLSNEIEKEMERFLDDHLEPWLTDLGDKAIETILKLAKGALRSLIKKAVEEAASKRDECIPCDGCIYKEIEHHGGWCYLFREKMFQCKRFRVVGMISPLSS